MIRLAPLAVVLSSAFVLVGARTEQNQKTQPAKPNNPMLWKAVTIRDVPRNNSQPLSTVFIPADWRAASDMKWTLASVYAPFALRANFTAPDGLAAVEFFAIPQGRLNTSPAGKEGSVPADVTAALNQLAKSSRPKAQLKLLAKKTGEVEKPAGPQAGRTAQTGVIRVSYEENGRTFEEEFAGTLHVVTTSLGQGYETRVWFIEFPRAIKAAQGKLDDLLPLGRAICRSARPTPEFLKAVEVAGQVVLNIQRQNLELTKLEGQMWLEANRQVNDAWRAVCEQRWAADQKIADGRGDILGGVRRFTNESNREVIAPVTYGHLWENGQGYYLMTNDASFRPGPEFKGTWTKLKAK